MPMNIGVQIAWCLSKLLQPMCFGWFPRKGAWLANGFYVIGIVNMVKVGIDAGKSLGADKFFFIEASVWLPELGVSFWGNIPQSVVISHLYLGLCIQQIYKK